MANPVSNTRRSEPGKRIASLLHLALVLAIIVLLAYRGSGSTERIANAALTNRPVFYIVAILSIWLMLAVVLSGLKSYGTPLSAIFGDQWHSFRDFGRDTGIAAVFWILATMVLSVIADLLGSGTANDAVKALLPHGWLESILWIGVSINAGICEEAIYRGYLQRQLIAVTRSVPAGIILSALAFGFGHGYKGLGGMMVIVLYGLLLGALAWWRKSVRPGMIAHSFSDAFAGVLAGLLKLRVA